MNEEKNVITKTEDILRLFKVGFKKRDQQFIGMECEKSGIYIDKLEPVQYEGNKGYRSILKRLQDELGWQIVKSEENNIYELERGENRLTLEGDGRIEFSSRPRKSLHNLARDFRIHQKELVEISKIYNIVWLGIGWQPFHGAGRIKTVPTKRYRALRDYMQRVSLREADNKKCNGIHTSFDFISEKDAISKFQLAIKVSPIIEAMFCCSPFNNGKTSKYLSARQYHTKNMDRRRRDFKKEFLFSNFSLEKWINFCLDKTVFYIIRDNKVIKLNRITFRNFIEKGYRGYKATFEDFGLHMQSIWTDVRIKEQYIEWRSFDTVPPDLVMAAPALTKGILYGSKKIKDAIEDLVKNWTFNDIQKLRRQVYIKALQTPCNGKKILDYAKELIKIADDSLKSFKILNEDKQDESIYLDSLKDYILVKEQSPAGYALEQWNGVWRKDPRKLIEWCAY